MRSKILPPIKSDPKGSKSLLQPSYLTIEARLIKIFEIRMEGYFTQFSVKIG
jgi:hypothetical protein